MKVKNLIACLNRMNPEAECGIMDGFNGGGAFREINLGPFESTFNSDKNDDTADFEDLPNGHDIVVMGYGCY